MMRLWWALGFLLVGLAVYVCLVPGPDIPSSFEMNDKVAHLIGHGLLAGYFSGLVPRRSWWKIFVFLLLLGGAIEMGQHSMHVGREADARDLIANSCGALLGLALGWLGFARWPQWVDRLLGRRVAS
jgi:VanZ family protein